MNVARRVNAYSRIRSGPEQVMGNNHHNATTMEPSIKQAYTRQQMLETLSATTGGYKEPGRSVQEDETTGGDRTQGESLAYLLLQV